MPFRGTETLDAVVAQIGAVDRHDAAQTERPHHRDGKPQVVQAERRRLRDQHHEVGVAHRLDDRTRGARRGVDQDDVHFDGLGGRR